MTFIQNFGGELDDDNHRYIKFNCSGVIDFIEDVTIELSKTPKHGFTEIHPAVLYRKMYLPHMGNIMSINFMRLIGYGYQHVDETKHPEYKVYYRCVNYFHHSHDMITRKHDRYKEMSIDEAMKYIRDNSFDLELCDYVISEDFKLYLKNYTRGIKIKKLKNNMEQ